MAGWILSAHGTYESQGNHKLFLNNGKQVCMYVADGQILYNNRAWPLFTMLTNSPPNEVEARKNALRLTEWVWNYTATGTNDFPSGVFAVGSKTPVIPLKNGEQVTLGQILQHRDFPGTLYWLACRVYNPQPNAGLKPTKPV